MIEAPTVTERLLLMHIPKTGGTSIEYMLASWMGHEQIAAHVEALHETERDALGEKRFVSGHLGYAELRRLPYWSGFKRAVVLREPYAHLASNIRMTARFGRPGNEAQLATLPEPARIAATKLGRLDIEDPRHLAWFLAHNAGWATEAFTNTQTNYLGGSPNALQAAIENLMDFHYVGITDQLQDLASEFAALFDRPPPIALHANSATSPEWVHAPPLDHTKQDIRQVMAPLLENDIRLYEYVIDLLSQRVRNAT